MPSPPLTRHLIAAGTLACAVSFTPLRCAAQPSGGQEFVPYATALSYERVRLPDGEGMGLVGASVLFAIDDFWGVGPAVYGAAKGRRGGLFVGGLQVLRVWNLANGVTASASMFAGGGGGAAAPVGNGLMLRPSLGIWADVSRGWSLGASLSSVRFPGTAIHSNQLGLAIAWRGEFRHIVGGSNRPAFDGWMEPTGLGFDRIAATATAVRIAGGRSIWLVGGRAERRSEEGGFFAGIEGAAAAHGDAAGYMELLGNVGLGVAPLPDSLPTWRLGVRASLGLGGGGAVDTGGGLMAKAALTTDVAVSKGVSLMADAGLVRAGHNYRARTVQLALGMDLEPRNGGRSGLPDLGVARMDWTGTLQHHALVLRSDGRRRALDTIGLKIDRWLGDNLYVSGQAHSAFSGRAGAFSMGLLGVGVASSSRFLPGTVRVGADILVGAAGGGGVAISSGGVAQGLAWASFNSSARSVWHIGVGNTRAIRGHASSTVLDLSFSRSFGMAGT